MNNNPCGFSFDKEAQQNIKRNGAISSINTFLWRCFSLSARKQDITPDPENFKVEAYVAAIVFFTFSQSLINKFSHHRKYSNSPLNFL